MLGSGDVFVFARTRNTASRRNKFWLQRQEIQVNAHTKDETAKSVEFVQVGKRDEEGSKTAVGT